MAGTNLGTAYVTIMPSTKGISGSISNAIGGEATSAGTKAGNLFTTAMKAVLAGAGIVAVKKFFSDALAEGGKLQQSFGGLDTIYGSAADGMKKMAYEASKAGISANTYAEQAVSFGASLKQAYGSDLTAAAKAADMAIMDMADNSAKMGTDITMLQNAYQGFAKQNYTMLDNLKIGYGGTKKEMERLLVDAEKLTGVKYDINNLGDVYNAIHAVQQELGITGVAAAEAEGTFTGSMQSMKAAWQNLKADMALGNDITEDLRVVAISAKNYITKNLLPMIGNVLKAIPKLIGNALRTAFTNLPGLVDGAIHFIADMAEGLDGWSIIDKLKEIALLGIEAFKNTDWIGLGETVMDFIVAGVKEFASTLEYAFTDIAASVKEWFLSVDWPQVGRDIIQFIGDAIGSVGHFIGEALTNIATSAKETFKDVDWAEAGANAFHLLVEGLKAVGSFLWDAIQEIGRIAGEHMKDIDWPQVGRDILTFIVNGLTAIGSFLWEALKTIGITAWNALRNIDWHGVGRAIINFIVTAIKGIGSLVWTALKNIGTTAWNTFRNIDWAGVGHAVITFIVNGLKALGSLIWNALSNIGWTAWNTITNIDWWSVGANIINGIVSGIWSLAGRIGSALTSIASSAWASVKSFFKIGSPSKLMRDTVGKWIPLGIAEGIEEEAGAVTDAMNMIASEAVTSVSPDLIVDGTLANSERGTTNGSNITMNIYPSAGMDERKLADMIQQRLALLQRQQQAVWGTV